MKNTHGLLKLKDLIKKPLEYYFLTIKPELNVTRLVTAPYKIDPESFRTFLSLFEMDDKSFVKAKLDNENLEAKYGIYFTKSLTEFPIKWNFCGAKTLREIHIIMRDNIALIAFNKITNKANYNMGKCSLDMMFTLLPNPIDYDTLKTTPVEIAELIFDGYYDVPIREVLKRLGKPENNPYYSTVKPNERLENSFTQNILPSHQGSGLQQQISEDHLHAKILEFIIVHCVVNNYQIPDAIKLVFTDTGQDLEDIDYMIIDVNQQNGSMYINGNAVNFKFNETQVFTETGMLVPQDQTDLIDQDKSIPATFYRLFFTEGFMQTIKLHSNKQSISDDITKPSSPETKRNYGNIASPTLFSGFSQDEHEQVGAAKRHKTNQR